MKLSKSSILFALGAVLTVAGAQAQTELDPRTAAPAEIIVRVDAQGNREIFKASAANEVQDASSAVAAIETFVNDSNKVANVALRTELDQTSSTESWYYYYNPYCYYGGYNYGYNYSYNYYGYNYFYRPYFNYSYGYYNYYYYRWY